MFPPSTAKCFRCGATAQADTFEQARQRLNHAIGLARGIKCGDSYGAVKEIKHIVNEIKHIVNEIKRPTTVQPPPPVTQTKKEEQKEKDTASPKTSSKKFKDIKS